MKIKITKINDILMMILFVLQLGFHTPTGFDEQLSLICSILITIILCIGNWKEGKIKFSGEARRYLMWYSFFFALCLSTLFLCVNCDKVMLKRMLFETFIPVVLCLFSICAYMNREDKRGVDLLKNIVYAEVFVAIRAILYTPILQYINTMNTRLYGSDLGISYNNFSTSLTLVFGIALYLIFYEKSKIRIAATFIFLNILFSGSRKALIVSTLFFLLMFFLTSDRKDLLKKAKKIFIIMAWLAIISIYIFTNDFMYSLIGTKLQNVILAFGLNKSLGLHDSSIEARNILRETAWNIFLQHPILGVGYYGFKDYNYWGYYAHNNYLEILADLGMIGFVVYYSYYCHCLFLAFKMKLKNKWITNSIRPDILLSVFVICFVILEYGQVTYFRMFALVPFMVVCLASYHINLDEVKQRGK